jgi:hypothetical protein
LPATARLSCHAPTRKKPTRYVPARLSWTNTQMKSPSILRSAACASRCVTLTKHTLDPRIGVALVMESAIAMSKVDKTVPQTAPELTRHRRRRLMRSVTAMDEQVTKASIAEPLFTRPRVRPCGRSSRRRADSNTTGSGGSRDAVTPFARPSEDNETRYFATPLHHIRGDGGCEAGWCYPRVVKSPASARRMLCWPLWLRQRWSSQGWCVIPKG